MTTLGVGVDGSTTAGAAADAAGSDVEVDVGPLCCTLVTAMRGELEDARRVEGRVASSCVPRRFVGVGATSVIGNAIRGDTPE